MILWCQVFVQRIQFWRQKASSFSLDEQGRFPGMEYRSSEIPPRRRHLVLSTSNSALFPPADFIFHPECAKDVKDAAVAAPQTEQLILLAMWLDKGCLLLADKVDKSRIN